MARPKMVDAAATGPQAPEKLMVRATKDGFYPKDFRRRKGSVFQIRERSHFSDSEKERLITCEPGCTRHKHAKDRKGNELPIHTQVFGWMEWVDPETPARAVTAEDANNKAMEARMGVSSEESVI
jgi:hypothetical protein